MLDVFNQKLSLNTGARILLLAPGPHAAALVSGLRGETGSAQWTLLDSTAERLKILSVPLTDDPSRPARKVLARATRLPFHRHSFEAVISFEALFSIRPPWTVMAEFHRVLAPGGTLILFEPQSLGFFSALRDKLHGPGKRVFPLKELKYRLKRADYDLVAVDELRDVSGFKRPAFCVRATKIEHPVEPPPETITTKDMLERRKGKLGS